MSITAVRSALTSLRPSRERDDTGSSKMSGPNYSWMTGVRGVAWRTKRGELFGYNQEMKRHLVLSRRVNHLSVFSEKELIEI